VPIDRAATLRQAEKLLRQGKLDQAIAEYVRLVEDQPRDWSTANALGDLHVRAGHLERAIEQFSRIAENLSEQGFLPRASAVYKKILKLKPDADHALVQAGELAAQQGLLADARTFFAGAAHGRRRPRSQRHRRTPRRRSRTPGT
jgi:tetratricopeptide (TPR) repeat protein